MKKIKIFPSKSAALVTILVMGILFLLFDKYLTNLSKETLSNWLKAEEVNIIEGSLLTSVSKNHRVMLASDFLKGVVLLNFDKPYQLEQIQFGENIDADKIKSQPQSNNPKATSAGFFKKYVFASIPNKPGMVVVFSMWSSGFIEIFWFACALIASLFISQTFIVSYIRHQEHLKREKQAAEFGEKAARMAHDIRSPLMILDSLLQSNSDTEAAKSKLLYAVEKLRRLTGDVLEQNQRPESKVETAAYSLIEKVGLHFETKKEQYSKLKKIKFKLNVSAFTGRIKMDSFLLERAIGNLVDNSVDAISGAGEVSLSVQPENGFLVFKLADTGKGIPKDILPSIGQKNFSYDKKGGVGFGVYYSKLDVENSGGTFEIQSTVGQGTTVTMKIPISKNAIIDNKTVQLEAGTQLIVVDDDPLIRDTWTKIFKVDLDKLNIPLKIYSSSKEMLMDAPDPNKSVLLTDYDLKEDVTGLGLVEQSHFQGVSLLITGMANDPAVIAQARTLGVPVLCKDQLNQLKIVTV